MYYIPSKQWRLDMSFVNNYAVFQNNQKRNTSINAWHFRFVFLYGFFWCRQWIFCLFVHILSLPLDKFLESEIMQRLFWVHKITRTTAIWNNQKILRNFNFELRLNVNGVVLKISWQSQSTVATQELNCEPLICNTVT